MGDPVTMKTPDFGAESITEGTLMEWKANVGDFVKKGAIIAMVETDKVTVEATAEIDGILTEVFVKVDETAVAGADFCTITPAAAPAAAPSAAPAAAPAAPAAAPKPTA